MARGNFQRRIEIAQERQKEQKNKKLRKEQRSVHKALVHNVLWPLLDQFKYTNPNLPLGKMHLWVDSIPELGQEQSTVDEVDDVDSASKKGNHKKTGKSRAKGDAKPAMKKYHPRSHENAEDDNEEDDEPLLCLDFFFTGTCQGLQSGGKSKKGRTHCDLVHPSKKELTLASILKPTQSVNNLNVDAQVALKRSSTAALTTQKKLDGDEIPIAEMTLSKSPGIDMLYHLEVPLVGEGAAGNMTKLVTSMLAKGKVAVSSIAYVVYGNVLIFDRCDGGKVISPQNERKLLGIDDDSDDEDPKSDRLIKFPAAVLEQILMYLPGSFSGLVPMVCKNLRAEIGTQSPALWRQLIRREGWVEPKCDDQADPITFYKSFFISHERIRQRVEAFKGGVEKLVNPDNKTELSRGTALGSLSEYLEDLDSVVMHIWSENSVLIASQNDCMLHLYTVSKQNSSDEKLLREIMQVRLAPVPISKKIHCWLSHMAMDDCYVLFSFDVDGRSILASMTKDELLSNSTEEMIECGDSLKTHDLSVAIKDYVQTKGDDAFLVGDQIYDDDMIFKVIDLKEIGHGLFCILVNIDASNGDGEEDDVEVCTGFLSFSVSEGIERVLDYVEIPMDIASGTPILATNVQWKHRSEIVEIVCKSSKGHEIYVANVDRSGIIHQKAYLNQYRRIVPEDRAVEMPKYSSHALRTPSRLVGYSEIGGRLDVYTLEPDSPPIDLFLQQDFNTILSMNHLEDGYVLMLCRRDPETLPAEEDIDGHWFGENVSSISQVHCLYFIVIHIPTMTEIYVSSVLSTQKVDMMVAIGNDRTIAAAVGGAGSCFSGSSIVSLKTLEEDSSSHKQKKVKKKNKRLVAIVAKTANSNVDDFSRGMRGKYCNSGK